MSSEESLTTTEYVHRNILLKNLNSFRTSDVFTDITLVVEGKTFKAHKLVLASCSYYFQSMFMDEMLESKQNIAQIQGISASGFCTLLNYMYTSKLDIQENNVQDILATAAYTQVFPVVEACKEFLKVTLDVENCTDIALIAENYSLNDLKMHVFNFVSASFVKVAKTKDFHKLSPEQIEFAVNADLPINLTELKFLHHVLLWFLEGNENEIKTKESHAESILKHIRFYEIKPSQLEELLVSVFSNKPENPLYETIVKFSRLPENGLRLPLLKNMFSTRGMQLAIIKVGGFGINGLTNTINYSPLNERHWRHLTTIPHVEQCNFGTAVVNNELYVVGGCFDQSLYEVIHAFAFKYNPYGNCWQKIKSMQLERCRFTLNVLNNKLYAVAGSTENGAILDLFTVYNYQATKTAECYDLVKGTWSYIQSLPECRQQHAAVSYVGHNKNLLFVSGGLHDRNTVIASMFVYDEDKASWSSCAPLLTPRADHHMICYNYKIYVCGGWRDDPVQNIRLPATTIDVYDVATNCWQSIASIPTPRFHSAVVAHESKIYFVGGFHHDSRFHKDTAAIECYDIETNVWTEGIKNSQDFWEHTCVMMYVPKRRSDDET